MCMLLWSETPPSPPYRNTHSVVIGLALSEMSRPSESWGRSEKQKSSTSTPEGGGGYMDPGAVTINFHSCCDITTRAISKWLVFSQVSATLQRRPDHNRMSGWSYFTVCVLAGTPET